MYRMRCWYIFTGYVILCYFFFFFFSVAPFAPLLKYTCYMCNRQGAHKSHRISSSLCSHENALLYLYWYLYFMLIWTWCILYYVWWEAIKLFWIWIWIKKDNIPCWSKGNTNISKILKITDKVGVFSDTGGDFRKITIKVRVGSKYWASWRT